MDDARLRESTMIGKENPAYESCSTDGDLSTSDDDNEEKPIQTKGNVTIQKEGNEAREGNEEREGNEKKEGNQKEGNREKEQTKEEEAKTKPYVI